MKARFSAYLLVGIIGLWSAAPAPAISDGSPEAMAIDTVVARPACFAANVAGAAVFVVALPFALLSKSTTKTAHTLVVKPARATFKRPVGELTEMDDF